MKFTVLSGSPKGEQSITLQYLYFLARHFPQHQFDVVHVGKPGKHEQAWIEEVLTQSAGSDGVIWVFPVYYLLVPAQMKGFIEALLANEKRKTLAGKYATAITTSVHFFDHTAHTYIHGISEDLGMSYYKGFSAEMSDLMRPRMREQFLLFATNFLRVVEKRLPLLCEQSPIESAVPTYLSPGVAPVAKTRAGNVTIVTDYIEGDNLSGLVKNFEALLSIPATVVNLHQIDIKGGCLGCINCGYDAQCVYNDDMHQVYNDKLLTAQAIVFALNVRDRFFSARFKTFCDRQFFNGHRPMLRGKQLAFLVSGPLRQLPNLRQFIEAIGEVGEMNLVGVLSDEQQDHRQTTLHLETLASELASAITHPWFRPVSFLGTGGKLIFRDLIYKLKWVFRADHMFYKKHGHYNYPQRKWYKNMIRSFIYALLHLPFIRKEFQRRMKSEMVKPYRQIVDAVQPKI